MTPTDQRFWELADERCADPRITRSTMMGLPCLRWQGQFFACLDRRNGDLVVKLSASRVDELVDAKQGGSFAPAGRRFKQWATIRVAHQHLWAGYLAEALSFVMRGPGPSPDPTPDAGPARSRRPPRTRR